MATHVDTSYTSRNAHIYNFSQSDCGHRQHNKGASNTSSASDTQALSEATHTDTAMYGNRSVTTTQRHVSAPATQEGRVNNNKA